MFERLTITITEEQRQGILLALALMALQRPGFDEFCNDIALLMDNRAGDRAQLYDDFRRLNSDHVKVLGTVVDQAKPEVG